MFLYKKNRKINFLKICIILLIATSWIFSGWPHIFNFPPKIQKAQAAEYLSNPSFTGSATDWTLSVTTYNGTIYQDTAGSIETTPGIGRNNDVDGHSTQDISTQINSTDIINLNLYWKKSWVTIASIRQDMFAQIEKPSTPDVWTTIWSDDQVLQDSGWISVGSTDVSSYFDETGIYGFRFFIDPRNGNNNNAETLILIDNASLDVTTSGALTVDIVDAAGDPVAIPSMAMSAVDFSFDYQTANGTFGVSTEKIRVENTTTAPAWTLTIAATSGSTAFWDGTASDYDFNDPTSSAGDGTDTDSLGGQMTINASGGTLGGTCSATNITKGSSASFSEGSTDSITLLTAGASADTSCYWDFTGVSISQTIPAEQPADSYSINITLTITAS